MASKKKMVMDKPNLPGHLFWEFRYDDIEWREEYRMVIARVVERGKPEHWAAIIRYYGVAFVIDALKNEIVFLPDDAIEKVCVYFFLSPEELLCYRRKPSKPELWI